MEIYFAALTIAIPLWMIGYVLKDILKYFKKKQKYNEMLDFVNRISAEMLRNDFVLNEKWYEQAQQLIKEATEL